MPQPPHLEPLAERNLQEIRTQIRQMGDLVAAALEGALAALDRRDRRLAYQVILGDNRIDALQHAIDHLCQVYLVRHMPAGSVLRFVISTLKVNSELERIGDYADAIAHRAVALVAEDRHPQLDAIGEMGRLAVGLMRKALQSFLAQDPALATIVLDSQGESDRMNATIFEALTSAGELSRLDTRFALVAVLNRLERVADRAANIAEEAIYAAKGEVVQHVPRGGHRVLFLSEHDACLGPLAEVLASAAAPLTVSFASAGIAPRSTFDARMVAFLERKGYALRRPRPRGLDEVSALEHYSVVVTLTREAEERCPPLPYHTVALAWDLPDPGGELRTHDEATLEACAEAIVARVADLLSALNVNPTEAKEQT